MNVLQVDGLKKSFGERELFHDVSFRVEKGECVGLVGANGTGKTTLLKCLLGQTEIDEGNIFFHNKKSVGYLAQQQTILNDASHQIKTIYDAFLFSFDEIKTLAQKKFELEKSGVQHNFDLYSQVVDEFEKQNGYDFESRLKKVAFGLGFSTEDFQKEIQFLSGGQKTRVGLAMCLLKEPELLFLDEPTNHLDIMMIEWLEDFLKNYSGGVLLISHDRTFLNRVAQKIISIEHQTIVKYAGNYDYFVKVRDARRKALEKSYEKQQEEIAKTEAYIARFKAGIKAKQARGRQSQLNRLQRIELPKEPNRFNFFEFHRPEECAERVLECENLAIKFDDVTLFEKVSFLIRRGERVGLVGKNGTGKTTLLNSLMKEFADEDNENFSGNVKLGSRVKIGYFSQYHENLNLKNTVLQEILNALGKIENDREKARSYLGAFQFRGDDVVEKRIEDLSGGEQSRLSLLKLMLSGANFLILDEPTNHLDIPAKEAIENALLSFAESPNFGTFLVVSHDRFFLDKITNRTFELADKHLKTFEGNYSYAHEKLLEQQQEQALREKEKNQTDGGVSKKGDAQKVFKDAKEQTAKKKLKNFDGNENFLKEQVSRAEAKLLMAEAELKLLERDLNEASLDYASGTYQTVAKEYESKQLEVEKFFEEWSNLLESLESMEARGE